MAATLVPSFSAQPVVATAPRFGLGKKFWLIAFVILLIAGGNVVVILNMLTKVNDVAVTVNAAGRLRMLSQKIAFETAYAMREPRRGQDSVNAALADYESMLALLERGGRTRGYQVHPIPSHMTALIEPLRQDWVAYRQRIEATNRHLTKADNALGQIAGEATRLLEHAEKLTQALTDQAQKDQKRMLDGAYVLFLAEALIMGLIFLAVRQQVIIPIRMLAERARQMALGNYGSYIDFDSADEIGELTSTFNFASRQIASFIARIEQNGEDIRQAESMFRGLAENSIAGVYITLDEKFVYVNRRMIEMFAYEKDHLTDSLGVLDIFVEDDRPMVAENIRRRLEDEVDHVIYEARGRRSDGTVVNLEIFGSKMELRGRAATIGVMLDVTSRRTTQQQLQYLATHDPLTGLANRNLLRSRLDAAIAASRESGKQVALFLLDLDRFKVINDSLGHEAGDALLRAVSERLTASVRASDTVARLGGDEFVILMSDLARAEDAALVANKVLAALSRTFVIGHQVVYTSASIGISLYPQDGDLEHLLKNADLAMYRAKQGGRNSFHFYAEEMTSASQRRFSMEVELRHAIEHGELFLEYQPKVCMRSGSIVGVEALLRWQHPERGRVSPAEFIPLAEETGLIMPVGEWALYAACAQNRAWHDEGLPRLSVAVNLSAKQFHFHDLVRSIRGALEAADLPPAFLELELTESTIMHDVGRALAVFSELKEMGIKLSLDDFGTGYSSLNYLRRFPFDSLKLDKSFIHDAAAKAVVDSDALLKSLIALGHDLGLEIVAEGVETQAQWTLLRSHGCDVMQGYFFSPPLPPERFRALLLEKLAT